MEDSFSQSVTPSVMSVKGFCKWINAEAFSRGIKVLCGHRDKINFYRVIPVINFWRNQVLGWLDGNLFFLKIEN